MIKKEQIPISPNVFDNTKIIEWNEQLQNNRYPEITFNGDRPQLKEGHTPDYRKHYRDIVKKFEKPTIVDFGGGVGIDYQQVEDLDPIYYIVETLDTYLYAQSKKELYSKIKFFDSIFKINEKIDIFYSDGGIQYAMNIFKIIEYINTILNPRYILLHKTRFTPKETYITQQINLNCLHWMFNLSNLIEKFNNYTHEVLPEENFPSYYKCKGVYGEPCEYIPILFTRIEK